jgi:SMI1 / KNR4 family (SUKH-1)
MISHLNRIMNWLQVNCPDYAASFIPGLSIADIQAIEEKLQFKLPEALCELYQWHNGTEEDPNHMDAFVVFHFSPLGRIIETYEYLQSIDDSYLTLEDGRRIFPFSHYEKGFLAVVIESNETLKAEQIVVFYEGGEEYIAYDSMQAMANILADAYEAGAFVINEDGYLDEDANKTKAIMKKYTPETLTQRLLNHMGTSSLL